MRCGTKSQIRGCPRNCKRRAKAESHWEVPGKAAPKAMTREPGDLPSATEESDRPAGFRARSPIFGPRQQFFGWHSGCFVRP